MNIVKGLKLLRKIENEDLRFVLSELLEHNTQELFEDKTICECIDMSKRYWNWPWNYYRYKDTKKKIVDYWDKVQEIQKTKGSDGYKEFHKNVEEHYDPVVYKTYSLKMEYMKKELEQLGFKVELTYSKDPESYSYHESPDRMYLTISY